MYTDDEKYLIIAFDKFCKFVETDAVADRERMAELIKVANNTSLVCCQIMLEFWGAYYGYAAGNDIILDVLRQLTAVNEQTAEL